MSKRSCYTVHEDLLENKQCILEYDASNFNGFVYLRNVAIDITQLPELIDQKTRFSRSESALICELKKNSPRKRGD